MLKIATTIVALGFLVACGTETGVSFDTTADNQIEQAKKPPKDPPPPPPPPPCDPEVCEAEYDACIDCTECAEEACWRLLNRPWLYDVCIEGYATMCADVYDECMSGC